MYAASASLVYQRNDLGNELTGYGLYTYDYDKDRSIATAVAAIRSSEAMAEAVKTQLGSGSTRTPGELMGMVSVGTSSGSDLVYVDAVSTDPKEAAAVANAYADQFIIYRQNADRAQVAAARDVVETQIKTLSPTDLQTDYGLMLQEKYETLRILEAMQDGGFTLLRPAVAPWGTVHAADQAQHRPCRSWSAWFWASALAFLLEYLDKRIKDEKTLEQCPACRCWPRCPCRGRQVAQRQEGAPVDRGRRLRRSGSALLESFRTLRSSLQYFDVDGDLHTILITSGLPQEGKTVTTVNLAISLALSGKRVIILEADLRRPDGARVPGSRQPDRSLRRARRQVLRRRRSRSWCRWIRSSRPGARGRRGPDPLGRCARTSTACTSGPLPPNPAELLRLRPDGHTSSPS